MRRLLASLAAAVGLLGLSACAPPDIPYAKLEAKYASPASQYAVLAGGVRMHYRDEGNRNGPAIVLVHGFSASLHAWEPWVHILAPDYRLISLDLPGHGLTQAPPGYHASTAEDVALVDELTRKLGAQRFVLAGNSMGGGVAWNYALAHPDRLRGLVLVDAAGWPRAQKNGSSPIVFKLLANPAGRALLKSIDTRGLAERGLKDAYYDPKLVTPALVDRYSDMARAPGHKDILLTMQSQPRKPVTPQTFQQIHTPTLILWGDQDRLIPVADAAALGGAIPGAKVVTYPGVGHVPMEQIPNRSATDLKAFLATLPN